MLSAAALFVLLYVVMMRRPRREGMLTLTFGLWYGISRIVEDSLRIDKRFFGLTGSQWTALTVATICAALLVWFAAAARPRRRRAAAGRADSSRRGRAVIEASSARRWRPSVVISGERLADLRLRRPRDRRRRLAQRHARRGVGLRDDDRRAGVAALAHRGHQRHLRHEGHVEVARRFLPAAFAEDRSRARRSAGRRTSSCSRPRRSGAGSCARPSCRRARPRCARLPAGW